MTKRQLSQLKNALKKHQENIGKERDEIRQIANDAEYLADCCNDAYEAIEEAIDSLSEIV